MLYVYLSYPVTKMSGHRNPDCAHIRKQGKPGQRICRLNADSISDELRRFRGKAYRFTATPEFNDMWLEIEFGDAAFEEAVARHVKRLIGQHYRPFAGCNLVFHC